MPARFTLPYGLLVAAWLVQAGFVMGLPIPREAAWRELAALGLVAAIGPLAPDEFVPFVVAIPVTALVVAAAPEPAPWH